MARNRGVAARRRTTAYVEDRAAPKMTKQGAKGVRPLLQGARKHECRIKSMNDWLGNEGTYTYKSGKLKHAILKKGSTVLRETDYDYDDTLRLTSLGVK